ncbi:MAG: hypothetical protein ABL959_09565 [Pyrinomonadaceae bacterium]
MAEKKKPTATTTGGLVEMADKETGFYDPVTQFKIVREQQVPLGETVGEKTNRALLSGQILRVSTGKMVGTGSPDEEAAETPE